MFRFFQNSIKKIAARPYPTNGTYWWYISQSSTYRELLQFRPKFFPNTSSSIGSQVFHALELPLSRMEHLGTHALSHQATWPRNWFEKISIFFVIFSEGSILRLELNGFDWTSSDEVFSSLFYMWKKICKHKQKSDSIRPFPWGYRCSRIRD